MTLSEDLYVFDGKQYWAVPAGFSSDKCTGLPQASHPNVCVLHDFQRRHLTVPWYSAHVVFLRAMLHHYSLRSDNVWDVGVNTGKSIGKFLAVFIATPFFRSTATLPHRWYSYQFPIPESDYLKGYRHAQ